MAERRRKFWGWGWENEGPNAEQQQRISELLAARFGLGFLAVLFVALLGRSSSLAPHVGLLLALGAWALFVLGEGLERMLFFRALSAPKMPGAVGP